MKQVIVEGRGSIRWKARDLLSIEEELPSEVSGKSVPVGEELQRKGCEVGLAQ